MDDLKSDALRDMDVEIRLDATRRKPRFIIETAEMTPALTRLIQQLTARAAVPIIGYQQDKAFPLQQDSLVRVWAANGHVYAATETDEFLLRQRALGTRRTPRFAPLHPHQQQRNHQPPPRDRL